MRGPLILRLVDIMLLLLLTLMAAASIEPIDTDLPITHQLKEKGRMPAPLPLKIYADGRLEINGQDELTMEGLSELLMPESGRMVIYASAEAPAPRLIEVARTAQAAHWYTAFVVERRERALP